MYIHTYAHTYTYIHRERNREREIERESKRERKRATCSAWRMASEAASSTASFFMSSMSCAWYSRACGDQTTSVKRDLLQGQKRPMTCGLLRACLLLEHGLVCDLGFLGLPLLVQHRVEEEQVLLLLAPVCVCV